MSKDIFAKCSAYRDHSFLQDAGLYPYFRPIDRVEGNSVYHKGRRMIMVGSNNYLGLAHDPRVIEAAQKAIARYGSGCTGSRFLNGTLSLHEELEEALAKFLNREAVVIFSTGFFANQGAIGTLLEADDFILSDRENHASIMDGCKFSDAKCVTFRHNDMANLRSKLEALPEAAGKLIVVDGVFSMSGDVANIEGLVAVAKEFGAKLYVDEAHSLGVFGVGGQGVTHSFGQNDNVDLVMGTFSKSLGSMGGFIGGSKTVVEYLKHKARCFMFTASLAPAVAAAVLKALEIMQAEPERMQQLWKNTYKMHKGFREMGLNIGITKSPIVPILIGSETKAFMLSQKLIEKGIFTTPAAYPAVGYGEAVLRTSYMATHTEEELDIVLEAIDKMARVMKIREGVAYNSELQIKAKGFDFTEFMTK